MLQIIQKRMYAYWFSGILTLVSVVLMVSWGFNFGIDFKGGTLMEIQFSLDPAPDASAIEQQLSPIALKSLTIQPTNEHVVML